MSRHTSDKSRKTPLRLAAAFEALVLLMVAGMAIAASVTAPNPEASCVPYDSAYESAPLFEIKPDTGRRRVYFYNRRRRCASEGPCAWRQKSYLVAGNMVFAGAPADGFRCVYYGTATGHIIAGFVPVDNLASISEDPGLSTQFLAGKWMYEGDYIEIKQVSPGKVSGEGQAYYQTQETVNDGEFAAQAALAPGQSELVFKEGTAETDCAVTIHRRGPYLVAEDNSACGGMNVRFNGIYTRVSK